MAEAISADKLREEAGRLGVQFRVKDGNLQIKMPATKTPATEAFRKRLIAAKPIILASSGSPKILKDKLKQASTESWLAQANNYANQVRDKYLTPAIQAAGGFVGRHSWLADLPGINTPEDASKLGGGIATEAEKSIIPDSLTGKGINAALALTGGESAEAEEGLGALRGALGTARGRIGVPALVGGIAGGASGEGFGSGVLQGLGAGAAGELPRVPGEVKGARDYIKRQEMVRRSYDDVVPGEKLSPVLQLKSFDELRDRYGNWVRALKDGRVSKEAGQRFASGMQDLTDAIHSYALSKAQQLKEDFMNKTKVPLNPRSRANGQYTDQLYAEMKEVREQIKGILSDARQLTGAMKTTRKLRSQVFDNLGRPKQGPTAQTASETLEMTKNAIRDKLKTYNPAFRGTYDALNEQYRMFAGLRQIADNPEAIAKPSGHVDLDAINQDLDANPRRYQSRIGDDNWDSVKQLFRRGASDKPDYKGGETFFDQPGFGSRVRTMMYGTKGHAAASADVVGDIIGGAPMVTKPVGNIPGLLPKRAPVKPGQVPRLITGGAANEGEEKIRDSVQ